MPPELIVLVGLPRSGKSSWAKQQIKEGVAVVNPDSIRLALHGQRFALEAEDYVWAIAKTMVRALFLAGHNKIILDATNTTKKRRTVWLNPMFWDTTFKYIPTPPEECIRRAQAENDLEIVRVIQRMAVEFEPVTEDEIVRGGGKRT